MFSFGGRASPQGGQRSSPPNAQKPPAAQAPVAHYGQIIEYIQDRIYLAAYTHPPNDETPFPYPGTPARNHTKRSAKTSKAKEASQTGPKVHPPCYFSIDDELPYNRFHADFGPLHMGHLYRFSLLLNYLISDPNNEDRAIVLWSKPDSRSRANAACLLACYMILVQSWPPHLALSPIAQMEPPVMPFRDAGYSQADFSINIQDVLYGVWRAKMENLCSIERFKLEEYERFERVDQGDFNWITPNFVALASPQHELIDCVPVGTELYDSLPSTSSAVKRNRNISEPFRNVLVHFSRRNVGLVVRLNSQLYSPSYFTALGINHLDMIFDDGTVPPIQMVREFINIAHDMITVKKKAIGVHCKAGLGRTGCLIGAYLIYKNGFTANEVIAYMRFMRPGMVVGPQQHWLHINQNQFREWWYEDKIKAKLGSAHPSTPTKSVRKTYISNGPTTTPPAASSQSPKRTALGEITHNENALNPHVMDENLPAPTPGQPRKASKSDARHHPYARGASGAMNSASADQAPVDQVVEMRSHRQTPGKNQGETQEEWETRILNRRTSSQSPSTSGKKRAVSCTTTTTTTSTRYSTVDGGDDDVEGLASDVENWHRNKQAPESPSRPNTLAASKSGSGSGTIGLSKIRGSPIRRSAGSREVKPGGVRKTSARLGSVGGGVNSSR